jgi:hypothetical protein
VTLLSISGADPKELLFVRPYGRTGGPLFRSQADLAEALSLTPGTAFHDRPIKSISVFISQILRPGDSPGARPVSANMIRALQVVIPLRAGEDLDGSALAREAIEAIRRLNSSSSSERPVSVHEVWQALIREGETCERCVVFTNEPAEVKPNQALAPALTKLLIDRAILASDDDPPVRYEFYILDPLEAERMFPSLEEALKEGGREALEARRLIAKAVGERRLTVAKLALPTYLPPLCVYNPESKSRSGFVLFYLTPQMVSVAQMDENSLKAWHRDLFSRLLDFKPEPVRFPDDWDVA